MSRPDPPTPAWIYVPASRRELLAKLGRLDADLAIVDLEDGVAPQAKPAARGALREVAARGGLTAGPPVWLRINRPGTPGHDEDLALVRELPFDGWVLPKAEDPAAVRALAEAAGGEARRLALMVETVAGLARARDLAGAHDAVAALILGSADLRLELRARPSEARSWERAALHEVLLASRLHGRLAIDAVHFRFRDLDGLERDARVARELGFDGKSCIHPGQVETIRRVFAPTEDERRWADGVLEAWRAGGGERNGVVVFEGEMIEELHLRLARRILESV